MPRYVLRCADRPTIGCSASRSLRRIQWRRTLQTR